MRQSSNGRFDLLRLCIFCLFLLVVQGKPRYIRATRTNPDYITVNTKYGDVRGRTYNVSDSEDLDIFLGVPYAKPPTGDLRFARPEPISPWSPSTQDAITHGAKCVQRIITGDPVLEGVPFSEDCLFLDIYSTRHADAPGSQKPVMVYLHPGGFYGGSGAKYNYTNLALKGVVVVSVSFRLDVFGFLSTQDDVIPGNFGLFDAALALDFIKEIIGAFGGNAREITLFGASSGASMVSIFTISPLTRGKFQKAIIQSGGALCPWAVFTPGRAVNVPSQIALALASSLNCSINQGGMNVSEEILACLRAVPVDTLVKESVKLQEQRYGGNMVFVPVSGDASGFLPETPEQLLAKTDELVFIPTIVGFTTDDGSWLVPDPDDDGITYPEFQYILNAYLALGFPPSEKDEVYRRVTEAYLPSNPLTLNPVQLRSILIEIATDYSMAAFIIKQARLFSKAKAKDEVRGLMRPDTFVFQFDYRASYIRSPLWYGVGHSAEKGFVLGLTPGPDPFNYPNTTAEDQHVADLVTTMWSNFAKFGDPTPQPLNWPEELRWPTFGHSSDDQDLLVIDVKPRVQKIERNYSVIAWTGDSGFPSSDGHKPYVGSINLVVSSILILWKLFIS
ncbi:carboxylic ester hydrolase [Plakobranchus ocellatus]|uniref:Carboxylic ester hydrolase n=1 Tax=Plakobranchus ocellatus TaxID=259542 RepID=A0AAV4AXR0_9GAST|nr:carboxylic ester hydrolase [Plakobranchus ocellatus]